MTDAMAMGGAVRPVDACPSRSAAEAVRPQAELLEWLQSGKLTLMDKERRPVEAEQWSSLPADDRAEALAEFRRIVRGSAKAAVLFLK